MSWVLLLLGANAAVNAWVFWAYEREPPSRFRARARLACLLGLFLPFLAVQAAHAALVDARDLQRRFWRLVAEASETDEDSRV